MTVDLHLHTTASDGSMTPEELVKKAISLKYQVIAITDHDTVSGLAEGITTAKNKEIEVIPGIELNTDYKQNEIHILGYYIDYHNHILIDKLEQLKEMRFNRACKMVSRLQELGIDISWQEVLNEAGKDSIIGRSHLGKILLKKDYVASWDEAFDRYIGIGCPAYVSRKKITPLTAIKLIKNSGGAAVLAHPGLIDDQKLIPEIVEMGIDGLEVFYYEHSRTQISKYKNMAESLNLLITGGSDDHGPGNKDGIRLGKIHLDYSIVENLKNYLTNTTKINMKNKL